MENKSLVLPTHYELIISNISVDVVRKKIKNIHLSVYPPTGRVRIATPLNTEEETIKLFVISKLTWIKQQQRKFEKQERQTPRIYANRESHYFQGVRYLLNVIESDTTPKVCIRNKTYIDLYIKPNSSIERKAKIMNEWYRQVLKQEIPALIEKWEQKIGVKVASWQIKQMKTKWGTCNIEQKHIWFNLELAKKPLHCLEYVIVHEMIHLLERHHNERFLALMQKHLPQWKMFQVELNSLPTSYAEWD